LLHTDFTLNFVCLLETLTVPQLFKIIPSCYATRSLITVLTKIRPLVTILSQINPFHASSCYLKMHFNKYHKLHKVYKSNTTKFIIE